MTGSPCSRASQRARADEKICGGVQSSPEEGCGAPMTTLRRLKNPVKPNPLPHSPTQVILRLTPLQ